MSWWPNFYGSDVGKKAAMAVTGIVLFGFVLAHMLGNLKLYMGAEHFNEYAHWLREVGAPAIPHSGALWAFRIVLLVSVAVHIHAAYSLALKNSRARPTNYTGRKTLEASYAARTMRWGGTILLLFVAYHLAHLTWGFKWAHPGFVSGDAYHNVISGFQVWWVSAIYMAAQIALGFHLYHGLSSMFQSLGWFRPGFESSRNRFAQVFAWVVTIGNLSFPIAVLTAVVR
jgi:succinate dehydrogenase / fumarate reductase cytochrome b subunit